MPHTSAEPEPQAGDVVIHDANASPTRYLISTHPGPPQVVHRTYVDAVAEATGFATERQVDVWFTEDRRTFRRVVARRPAAGV